ncbi:MAG: alpha-mannosidase [Firmicutes bacterium]|nr:alpha-mannosidase [Bacillota bacterium]
MRKIHLICNAHLDPVWQWEWEEGAATALSTFRIAAQLCEEYDGFVFNHNEAILYKWIEEYERELFKKIQKLVFEGKWHIMGGWYLQPDCNMLSGESFVRQILMGKKYFKEKFNAEPTTAVNFDSFGHTRGLVQVLRKSGYDSYIFTRPNRGRNYIPDGDFIWVGYDGSEVIAHREEGYNTLLGNADKKILGWMKNNEDAQIGLIAWGVGNHGGGPSRLDLDNINKLVKEIKEFEILHSTPEQYFKELKQSGKILPRYEHDLNPSNPGCYTSQILIKQKYRQLENELYMVEKMLSHARIHGYLEYPKEELDEALNSLLMSQFHDIICGTSIQPVEETSLRLLNYGLEILSRLKARAFFALAAGQKKEKENEIPILVYNPHPYKVKGIFECEFMLPDQNYNEEFTMPIVYQNGNIIPSQPEKEFSNLNLDWRKRVIFEAELEPFRMNRFDCKLIVLPRKPEPKLIEKNGEIKFRTKELEVVINCNTGLIDRYCVNGKDFLKENSFAQLIINDSDDPWGMKVDRFRDVIGHFRLMDEKEGTEYSGVKEGRLKSVRVIEDGEVRSVVEAVFRYGYSFICQTYKLPKRGTEIEVHIRVNWNEKSKMLKLSIPTTIDDGKYLGQVAFGIEELPNNGEEAVSQRWTMVVSNSPSYAFSCINDGIYGSDFKDGEIRLSLLRSPGYCAHPIKDRPIMVQDRFLPRIDNGERVYRFWFNGGETENRLKVIDRESLVHNEKPYALSFFPSGSGKLYNSPIILDNESSILMTAFKKAGMSEDYILRLYEPTGKGGTTVIHMPSFGITQTITFKKFEVKTFKLDMTARKLIEVSITEE